MKILLPILIVVSSSIAAWATVDTQNVSQQYRSWNPFLLTGAPSKWTADSEYEYGFVTLNSQPMVWREWNSELMYNTETHHPYLNLRDDERNGNGNNALNFGDYMRFRDSMLHVETGFGINPVYLYEFQFSYEYQHRISGGFYGKVGNRYLHYAAGDVLVSSVGFYYYYGDLSYVTADYDFSVTEARGVANWGSGKWYTKLTPRLAAWTGVAAGQRLYDIFPLRAADQEGYILSAGLDFQLAEALKARAGYSYSEEKPNFIKRGVEGGLSLRF